MTRFKYAYDNQNINAEKNKENKKNACK